MGRLRQLFVWPMLLVVVVAACDNGAGGGVDDPALVLWALETCPRVKTIGAVARMVPVEDTDTTLRALKTQYAVMLADVDSRYQVSAIELGMLTPPSELADEHLALVLRLRDFARVVAAARVSVVQASSLNDIQAIIERLAMDEEEVRRQSAEQVDSLSKDAKTALRGQTGCDSITGGKS